MIRKPHRQHNALPKHCQNMTKGLYYHSLFTTLDISKAKFFFQRAVNTPRAAASLQPDMRKDCFLCSTIVLLAFTKANYRVRLFGLRSTLLHSARRLPGGVHDVHDKISCSRVSNVIQVHSTEYTQGSTSTFDPHGTLMGSQRGQLCGP